MDLSSSDEELISEINDALVNFIKSEETLLQFEPMNSFRRRMVHKIGTKYKLTSESTGEGTNRSVSLKKTELTDTKLENYFGTIDDPRIVMQKLLSIIFQKKISVAKENNLNYSKGVFRVHSSGTFNIHRDCARFEASNYKVSNFPLQFSATLHLQKAECGGELILYKKFWQQEDEKYRFPHFGYSKEVVTNTEFLKIKPDVGDIIIINPLHYHTISEIKGMSDRVSTGFFFAPSDEHALVCWS